MKIFDLPKPNDETIVIDCKDQPVKAELGETVTKFEIKKPEKVGAWWNELD